MMTVGFPSNPLRIRNLMQVLASDWALASPVMAAKADLNRDLTDVACALWRTGRQCVGRGGSDIALADTLYTAAAAVFSAVRGIHLHPLV